jgi:proteasome assembly chaperone (PAC2) family protein
MATTPDVIGRTYAAGMLTVDHWPELHEPALVVALRGWVDAGTAGAGAVQTLQDQLEAVDVFASIDLADIMDLQQTRPVARWESEGNRVIDWPEITIVAGRLGRDVVIVSGPEPSLAWPDVAAQIVEVAREAGVRRSFTLAGMPALVSHRRPVPVLATATHRSLAQELAPLRAAYLGPTGLQTIVQRALGDAELPCAGLWAQVPQYVSGSPSPPAIRALLRRLAELAPLSVDLRSLDERCAAYVARVDAGLESRPDVREIVDRIDQQQTSSTDDLVSEIEVFLRSQNDDDE